MKTPRTPRHNTGEEAGVTIDGRPVPYLSGVLPKDFAKRIVRLKKASGLTWSAFADALGVDILMGDGYQLYLWQDWQDRQV